MARAAAASFFSRVATARMETRIFGMGRRPDTKNRIAQSPMLPAFRRFPRNWIISEVLMYSFHLVTYVRGNRHQVRFNRFLGSDLVKARIFRLTGQRPKP